MTQNTEDEKEEEHPLELNIVHGLFGDVASDGLASLDDLQNPHEPRVREAYLVVLMIWKTRGSLASLPNWLAELLKK